MVKHEVLHPGAWQIYLQELIACKLLFNHNTPMFYIQCEECVRL